MKRGGADGGSGSSRKRTARSGGHKPTRSGGPSAAPEEFASSGHPAAQTGTLDSQYAPINLSCDACGVLFFTFSCWNVLCSCRHVLCPDCFSTVAADRGSAPYLTCPVGTAGSSSSQTSGNDGSLGLDIEKCVISHSFGHYTSTVVKIKSDDVGTSTRQMKKTAESNPPVHVERRLTGPTYIKPPDAIKDGYRHYQMLPKEEKGEKMMFSMAWPADDDDDVKRTHVQTTYLPADNNTNLSMENTTVLRNSMIKMHGPVMSHDGRQWKGRKEKATSSTAAATSDALDRDCMVDGKDDVLPDLLHALAHGRPRSGDTEKAMSDPRHKTAHMIAFVAACVLRMANQSTPTILQDVLSQYGLLFGLPVALYLLLKRCSLVMSRDVVNIKNVAEVCNKIRKGWNLADYVWGIEVFVYDNVGFKVRGNKVGYDQFTHIKVIQVPYKFLRRLGLYANGKISRTRNKWSEIRHEMSLENVLPSTQEYGIFHTRVLTTVDAVLSMYTTLPDRKKCKLLLDKWFSSGKKDFDSGGVKIPAEFAERPLLYRRIVADLHVDKEVEVVEDESSSTGDESTDDRITSTEFVGASHLEEEEVDAGLQDGDITEEHGLPLQQDLNRDSTVANIAQQASSFRSKTIELYNQLSEDKKLRGGEKPIRLSTTAYAAGDGAPSYSWLKQACQAGGSSNSPFTNAVNFCGGLHTLMMVLKSIGSLFHTPLLGCLLLPYRPTDKQQEWVMSPSDPTQCLREMYQQFSGILADAIEKTAQTKSREVGTAEDDTITAADVYGHMTDRAENNKLSMLALTQILFYEIVFMICDSEKTGKTNQGTEGCDPLLYRTAAKMALFVAAVSGSWKYVFILCEFVIFWEESSELEKMLWEEIVFTRQTKGGKRVFLDRSMEWTVKSIRSFLGKYSAPNMWQRLVRTTASLDKSGALKAGGMSGDGDFTPTTIDYEMSIVFCVSRLWSHDVNLWGEGSNQVIENGDLQSHEDYGGFVSADGKSKLNEDMLYLISTSTFRLEKYWTEYYLEGSLNQPQRPHSKVDLRKVPALQTEKAEADKKLRIWATSTDPNELEDFRKDDIIHNQQWMNCILPKELQREKLPPKSANRTVHAKTLAELRLAYKNYKPTDAADGVETPTEISFLDEEEQYKADGKSMSLKEELSLPFYKMTEETEAKFITKNYKIYDNILGPYDNNADLDVDDPQQDEDEEDETNAVGGGREDVADSQQSMFSLGLDSQ